MECYGVQLHLGIHIIGQILQWCMQARAWLVILRMASMSKSTTDNVWSACTRCIRTMPDTLRLWWIESCMANHELLWEHGMSDSRGGWSTNALLEKFWQWWLAVLVWGLRVSLRGLYIFRITTAVLGRAVLGKRLRHGFLCHPSSLDFILNQSLATTLRKSMPGITEQDHTTLDLGSAWWRFTTFILTLRFLGKTKSMILCSFTCVEEILKIEHVTKPYVDSNAHNRIKYRSTLLIKSESLNTCSHKT